MLGAAPVITFLSTLDADRSIPFYRDVLGLKFIEDSPFAVVFESAGTMLRIQRVETLTPAQSTALGWGVADITATVHALVAKGVTFERYTFVEQDDDGIWTAPGGTRVAWFKDPDGQLLSLTQFEA
jgi:catechol 2,3-dioxygenase-like lactoylglutathione lyase family enzyme